MRRVWPRLGKLSGPILFTILASFLSKHAVLKVKYIGRCFWTISRLKKLFYEKRCFSTSQLSYASVKVTFREMYQLTQRDLSCSIMLPRNYRAKGPLAGFEYDVHNCNNTLQAIWLLAAKLHENRTLLHGQTLQWNCTWYSLENLIS